MSFCWFCRAVAHLYSFVYIFPRFLSGVLGQIVIFNCGISKIHNTDDERILMTMYLMKGNGIRIILI